MAELGSGSGSSYPGAIDSNAVVEVNAPAGGKTKARAEVINDLSQAILNIETELGVDPAGSKATVVARIDQEHNADGSHKDTLIVTVSGHNQNITGRKVFASGISLGVDGLYGTSTTQATGRTTVGASGAMYFSDDVRTSGSYHARAGFVPVVSSELVDKNYIDTIHKTKIRTFNGLPTATQTITTGTWTQVSFDTETFDSSSEFTGNQFTATSNGYYMVNARAGIASGASNYVAWFAIYKQGTLYSTDYESFYIPSGLGQDISLLINDVVYLNTGNTLSIYVRHGYGSDRNISYATVNIIKIGE